MGGGRVIMWAMRMRISTVSLYANWGAASALGVVLLLVTLALPRISSPGCSVRAAHDRRGACDERRGRPADLRMRGGCGSMRLAALVLMFLMAPSLIIMPMSFSDSAFLAISAAGLVAALVRRLLRFRGVARGDAGVSQGRDSDHAGRDAARHRRSLCAACWPVSALVRLLQVILAVPLIRAGHPDRDRRLLPLFLARHHTTRSPGWCWRTPCWRSPS